MAAADAGFSAATRVGRDQVAVAPPRVTEDSTVSGETVATAGRAGSFPRAEFLELPERAFALISGPAVKSNNSNRLACGGATSSSHLAPRRRP